MRSLTNRRNPSPFSRLLPRLCNRHLGQESMGAVFYHQVHVSGEKKIKRKRKCTLCTTKERISARNSAIYENS